MELRYPYAIKSKVRVGAAHPQDVQSRADRPFQYDPQTLEANKDYRCGNILVWA